jgi:putative serine protease PepD
MSESTQSPSNALEPTEPQQQNTQQTQHTGESFRSAPKRSIVVPVVAALAVGALVGGVSGAGVSMWATSVNTGSPVGSDSTAGTITVNDTDDATLVTAVAAKASPSVVTISVAAEAAGGTGSGVILTDDGYILTNTHVVTLDGAVGDPEVTVTTSDGRLLPATIVGTDPISDLAVIKVDATDLTPAEFADSDDLNVGDTAIAIGAPLGLAGTVTDGIVSALNRSITVASSAVPEEGDGSEQAPDEENPFDFWQFDVPGQQQQAPTASSSTISLAVIQTDAAINPGNSGGALLDSEGQVIGINVAIASAGGSAGQSGSIGVGFAIPSNLAQRIADELIEDGSATHGLLGASVADATASESVPDPEVVGASIEELSQGGAAEAAGLQVGDIITRLNGIPITGKTDLTAQVRALAAGADAEVTYVRDGEANTVDVTLGELQ